MAPVVRAAQRSRGDSDSMDSYTDCQEPDANECHVPTANTPAWRAEHDAGADRIAILPGPEASSSSISFGSELRAGCPSWPSDSETEPGEFAHQVAGFPLSRAFLTAASPAHLRRLHPAPPARTAARNPDAEAFLSYFGLATSSFGASTDATAGDEAANLAAAGWNTISAGMQNDFLGSVYSNQPAVRVLSFDLVKLQGGHNEQAGGTERADDGAGGNGSGAGCSGSSGSGGRLVDRPLDGVTRRAGALSLLLGSTSSSAAACGANTSTSATGRAQRRACLAPSTAVVAAVTRETWWDSIGSEGVTTIVCDEEEEVEAAAEQNELDDDDDDEEEEEEDGAGHDGSSTASKGSAARAPAPAAMAEAVAARTPVMPVVRAEPVDVCTLNAWATGGMLSSGLMIVDVGSRLDSSSAMWPTDHLGPVRQLSPSSGSQQQQRVLPLTTLDALCCGDATVAAATEAAAAAIAAAAVRRRLLLAWEDWPADVMAAQPVDLMLLSMPDLEQHYAGSGGLVFYVPDGDDSSHEDAWPSPGEVWKLRRQPEQLGQRQPQSGRGAAAATSAAVAAAATALSAAAADGDQRHRRVSGNGDSGSDASGSACGRGTCATWSPLSRDEDAASTSRTPTYEEGGGADEAWFSREWQEGLDAALEKLGVASNGGRA